mmetsp:Transcript_54335/g.174219  ORF Transcript_54335/g.174219 Transcript_54335/m.174219 type:complete len:229 (-) Transcript_54335:245-931(-)
MALLAAWPTPAPLEGVKSRKRAIFRVTEGAEIPVNGEALTVSGVVQLTLGSRVAAVCEAGHALTEVLLGQLELQGPVFRNEGLSVALLGPHLGGPAGAGRAARLAAAVATVLEARPQVVVLDEAREADCKAWARAFRLLLRSEALRSFRGAVVVRAGEPTPAVRRACGEHWAVVGERLWQLEMADEPPDALASDPEVFEEALEVEDAMSAGVPQFPVCALPVVEVGGA